MEDLHPHWRATEDDVPVTVRETQVAPTQFSKKQSHISRRPAAIAGIALVLGTGFYIFRDDAVLQGQVSAPFVIRITVDGFDPESLTVQQGDTVTFTNDSPVPQLIESDALCSSTGYCLYTSTLFPGESENFTITREFTPGAYTYVSSINAEIKGEILIEGASAPVPQSIDEPRPSAQFQSVTTRIEQSIAGTGPFATNTASALNDQPPALPTDFLANAPNRQASIPQNPYALGSDRAHPFNASGEPIEELFGNSPLHSGAPKPLSQPETGPGLWAVSLMSLAGIFLAARRKLSQEVVYKN